MGQPLRVVSEKSVAPNSVRFEVDRSLTGTGHETYGSAPQSADRPSDVLARRLFEETAVAKVHVFSNVIDLTFGDNSGVEALEHELQQARSVINGLFTYYSPGVKPTPVVTPPAPTT